MATPFSYNEGSCIIVNSTDSGSSIDGSYFDYNAIGIEVVGGAELGVDGCTLVDNREVGIDISASAITVENSSIIYNSYEGTDWSTYAVSAGIFLRDDALSGNELSAGNEIYGNRPGNPDLDAEYEVINASVYDVNASYCNWGEDMDTAGEIEDLIYDEYDDGLLGDIDYSNWD